MKLAEALLQRTEYQQKLDALEGRLQANLKIQEGDEPHEDPKKLLNETMELNETLCVLVQRINRTNQELRLDGERTLSDALAERDMLRKKRTLLDNLAQTAQQRDYRLSHSEVRMQVTLDLGKIQKEIDALSRRFRELDTRIQGINWTSELLP